MAQHETALQVRNRLRAQRPRRPIVASAAPDVVVISPERQTGVDPAFLVEHPETHRTTITTPLREVARKHEHMLELSGRLVEAEKANRNGAFWSQGDLEFGLPTVGFGPLNWLHEERTIVGTLLNPSLVTAERAAAETPGVGPHITTDSVVWSWIYPEEAQSIERHVATNSAWMSMECVSETIQCVGENGCGAIMAYNDAQGRTKAACEHIRERASHRRLVDPVFLGAAVVLPPFSPGWGNASLGSRRTADSILETATLEIPSMDADAANLMVAKILEWSGR